MAKIITYLMASTVGLVIALALAMPSLRWQSQQGAQQQDTPMQVTTVPAPAASEPSASVPPVDNQTLLSSTITSGSLAVTINNKPVSFLPNGAPSDVSALVHPGANTMFLYWPGPASAEVHLTHAALAGQFRDVESVYLVPANTNDPGTRSITFYM